MNGSKQYFSRRSWYMGVVGDWWSASKRDKVKPKIYLVTAVTVVTLAENETKASCGQGNVDSD